MLEPGKLQKFAILLEELEKKAKTLKCDRLSSQQRETLLAKLEPVIRFYSQLKNCE
jgi:hypothetical protein